MKMSIRLLGRVALLAALLHAGTFAGLSSDKSKKSTQKVETINNYAPITVGNVFNYYGNNGDGSFNPYKSDNEGFEFPKGSNVGTTIFEDGLVWTAYRNDTLKCGGSTYNHGLQPGRILLNGTAMSLPVADDPMKKEDDGVKVTAGFLVGS